MKFVYLAVLFTVFVACAVSATRCSLDASCNHGKCVNNTCVCDAKYADFDGDVCSYERKDEGTALLLSLLLGWSGADWFYLSCGQTSYIVIGVFKLLTGALLIFGCIGACCMGIVSSFKERTDSPVSVIIALLLGLIMLANPVWILVDWCRLAATAFPDGNGVPLKPW